MENKSNYDIFLAYKNTMKKRKSQARANELKPIIEEAGRRGIMLDFDILNEYKAVNTRTKEEETFLSLKDCIDFVRAKRESGCIMTVLQRKNGGAWYQGLRI